MRHGYRLATCPCGTRFPTLARAPGRYCSLRCAAPRSRPLGSMARRSA